MSEVYWAVRGTYRERWESIKKLSRDDLERAIIDGQYNDFLSDRADFKTEQPGEDERGHGKRLPYIGWFWRHVEFSRPLQIVIGDCGEFVGFMPKNKWGYPSRCLTTEEFSQVIALIDEAMRIDGQGGDVAKNDAMVNEKLGELWSIMQSFRDVGEWESEDE